MYDLVEVRNDVPFTTSKVIAEGTGVQHYAVQKLIQKYETKIARFGQVEFEMRAVRYSRGTNKEKVYMLNEKQATLLMMLMRNDGIDGIVVEFKTRLTEEFYRMRDFIREKQSDEWEQTRRQNKENRLKETDVIKLLVDYAKKQGSTNADKLYMVYTKLAKTIAKGDRDNIPIADLNNITLTENIILQTIRIDMSMGLHYKEIYADCRDRIERFKDIAYLNGKQNQQVTKVAGKS